MPIEIQIWTISIVSTLLTFFIAWQAYRLGKIMNASFGKWEACAWIVMIIYRSYALTNLSNDISQLKAAGYIIDSLSFSQWVAILGNLLFLVIIIYSKHRKRKRIYETLGV